MPARHPVWTTIERAENLRFADAWQRWRGDRLLPRRSDIDLPAIKTLLPFILLIEVRSPTEARIRVAGTELREFLGFELTGLDYMALSPPERRAIRSYRMWQLVGQPCGSCFVYHHQLPSGRQVAAEVVAFPIDPDEPGKPRLVLSSVAPLSAWREPVEAPATQRLDVVDHYAFLDIGAGIPADIVPPSGSHAA